jgi:hypothetical protein
MAGYPSPRADAVAGNSTTVLMSPSRCSGACRLAESVHRPSPDPQLPTRSSYASRPKPFGTPIGGAR